MVGAQNFFILLHSSLLCDTMKASSTVNRPFAKMSLPLGDEARVEYRESATVVHLARLDIHTAIVFG